MALIDVANATKIYGVGDEEYIALKDATMSVDEGEFVAIMGPSGSGKSTLLSILGALNPPTKGQLIVDEIDVYSLSVEKLADFRHEYIGFVFQQFQLVPYLTAIENVMLPLAIMKGSKAGKKEAAKEVLERVGLGSKLERLPSQLSGGEQERVAIARAIVNRPPILLADEPTGALDTKTADEIMSLFRRLNGEGQTILMVTHNRENAAYVGRTISIKDGAIEPSSQYAEAAV